MNTTKIYAILLTVLVSIASIGCTDGFEELNTNPIALPNVKPEEMLYVAETNVLSSSHCWSGIYASKYRWMQYGAGVWGYSTVQYSYFSNSIGNSIYDEYIEMGAILTHIRYLADKEENKEKYANLKEVARILLIAKGIQTSDLYGSLVYTEGWLARKGEKEEEKLSPKFDTQEELVDIWNTQLKECAEALKSNLNSDASVSLKGHDRAYNGDITKWIKASNALRLRLASRIWKIKPELAKAIATEVLSTGNAEYVFSSIDDDFILWFDKLYTNKNGRDWHSVKDMEVASYCLMNYLNKNKDPRKRIYFVINNLSPENIEAFNVQEKADKDKLIPIEYTRWEGSTASYDNWDIKKDRRRYKFTLKKDNESIDMRPANLPQVRLWQGNNNDGNGGNWAPIMSYADFSFLAAEFVLEENIASNKTAQQWYEDGVKASLERWNKIGKFCDLSDYKEMTNGEIQDFLNMEDIKWNSADKAKAKEQIYAQSYLEHYKNVDEAYALWKRTGYPNTESNIVRFDSIHINKTEQKIPRRVRFSYPNPGVHNYENMKARLDKMQEDPKFGDIQNEFGRIWWDAE